MWTHQSRIAVAVVLIACMISHAYSFFDEDTIGDLGEREGRGMGGMSFMLGSVKAADCQGSKDLNGTCYSAKGCGKAKGEKIGKCANGYGVCCRIEANCTAGTDCPIRNNGTRIILKSGDTGRYMYTFQRPKGIRQLKLEFLPTSTLANPDANGDCIDDSFTIMSGSTTVSSLKVCGNLTDQHMYLAFGSSDRIVANLVKKSNLQVEIKVTYYSYLFVPAYCLQYYTADKNTMKSFGFPHQLNNQYYTMCIDNDVAPDIQISECTNEGVGNFVVTGDVVGPPGQPASCETDWIQVFGHDKKCGKGFKTITSAPKPFAIRVNFDEMEVLDIETAFGPTDPDTGCPALCFEPGGTSEDGMTICNYKPATDAQIPFCEAQLAREDTGNTGFCLQFSPV